MMICPETYYENHLKGKTQKEILSAVRSLKREIGHLKRVIETRLPAKLLKGVVIRYE